MGGMGARSTAYVCLNITLDMLHMLADGIGRHMIIFCFLEVFLPEAEDLVLLHRTHP